ncbi:hypothetical protein Zmor_012355, partial [Zophobas morio]
ETSETQLFNFSETEYASLVAKAPWNNDPLYFKKVKISSVATIKMATHAFAGGDQEIMGILVGRVKDRSCVVFDSYPLPIIGTETRSA